MVDDLTVVEVELLHQLANYRKGNYQYGKYRYEGDIIRARTSGKIFLLRGALKSGDWGLIAICLVPTPFLLIDPVPSLVTLSIVMALFIPLFFLKYGSTLVIGPRGFIKFNLFGKKVFLWQEVVEIRGELQNWTMILKGFFIDGTKCKCNSHFYTKKEFPHDFPKNFYRLFKVYSGVSDQFASTQTSFGLGDIPL